ncbi:16S rRNA (uracil(1498)-N(3))-methyltransferase [Thiohalocapsa marina]|uniref:16S rRNA (uracil(1498)-N(3))-methyltransferase n=1 Tax=Thiohalocapsa marina TaxID=424902 RepID=UPI0036DA558D
MASNKHSAQAPAQRDMRIHRIYTPQGLAVGTRLRLEPTASKHLTQVLRLKAGDPLVLFNGDGRDYAGALCSAERASAQVQIDAVGEPEPVPALAITLALGISRGERMDYALQKAVELGVTRVRPLFTERSVVRLRDERLQKRVQHWQGVIVAACEQSGRRRLPRLAGPEALLDWLPRAQPGGLLLDHRGAVPLPSLSPPADDQLTVLVGPEGGLAPAEREAALGQGFRAVRLGPRIMRTETAPLAALAAIQTLWGDFRA